MCSGTIVEEDPALKAIISHNLLGIGEGDKMRGSKPFEQSSNSLSHTVCVPGNCRHFLFAPAAEDATLSHNASCGQWPGCGGHKLSSVDFDRDDVFDHAEAEYGYVRMSVDRDRSILLEYIYSDNGAVGDTKEITVPNQQCRGRTEVQPEPAVRLGLNSELLSFNLTALRSSVSLSQPATVELSVLLNRDSDGVQTA